MTQTLPVARPIFVPLRIKHGDQQLSFFSMSAAFGAPRNVTVSELAIESFFPADPATTRFLLRSATPQIQ